ncbi:MAG TPA: glycosyltransferase [Patescibacteria group bacterium]|nr:glycosyltransferase [Patescibacteria group bacterium]
MRRILILTASYGSGHNEAARCVAAEVARRGAEPLVVDHFRDLVHPLFDRATRAVYLALLRRLPAVWGLAYALGDRLASDSPLTFGASRMGGRRLGALLERLAPDAVVTVHATPALAMAALARAGRRVPPHTTVVTDFVAHSQWIASGIDRYCVAADEVGHDLVARGIPRERVVVTGVPVRAEFASAPDPREMRRALGLPADVPVVLAMAGSWGSVGRLPDVARTLARIRRPVVGVLVAGHDAALRASLERLAAGSSLRVFGFVPDLHRLMAAADLVVTKAGGMTLAEAMAVEVPLLFYGSLPGQERRNERFAAAAGVALVARRRPDLERLLERALRDPDLLELLRAPMRARRRPDATRTIVDLVLADCVRAGAPR